MLYACSHMLELCWHMLWVPNGYVPTVSRSIYFYIYNLLCILSSCTFSRAVWGLFIQHKTIYLYSLKKLLLPAVASSSRNNCSSSLLLERMKETAGTLKPVPIMSRTTNQLCNTLLLYAVTSNSWNQNHFQVWLGPTPHRHSDNGAFTCGNIMSTYPIQPALSSNYFLVR
jgi:hypothetical protein